jgi:hypothetical protein
MTAAEVVMVVASSDLVMSQVVGRAPSDRGAAANGQNVDRFLNGQQPGFWQGVLLMVCPAGRRLVASGGSSD